VTFSPFVAGGPLGGDIQIYGGDVEGSQYFHLPYDMILLFNGEAAVVDVWGQPETRIITVQEPVLDANGKPVLVNGVPQFMPVPEPISNVPIYDRLYLGGSNNLRGFAFRDVGPRDKNGEPLGGQSMARATAELTFPIIEKARGAIFYDTGFVNADPYDFGTDHVASDVGVGIRLDLPVGPLRIDYGFPIQKDGRNGGGHFNFNVGYQF
jgi:outer membrane protein insertion porin family